MTDIAAKINEALGKKESTIGSYTEPDDFIKVDSNTDPNNDIAASISEALKNKGIGNGSNIVGHHDVKISDYSGYIDTPYMTESLNKMRAENQGNWEKVWNATKRIPANALLDVASGIGAIADIPDFFHGIVDESDREFGNSLSRWAIEQKQSNNQEWAPIYQVNEGKSWNAGEVGWWMEGLSGVISSGLGFAGLGLGTGALVSKAPSLLRMIGAGSKARQFGGRLLSATMLNQAETVLSGVEVFDTVKRRALSEGFSMKEAELRASSAAAHTVNINRANILLNITSAGMLMKPLAHARGQVKRSLGKAIPIEMGQEALEEVINNAAEVTGMREYSANGYAMDAINSLTSMEGTEAAFWGAIGGAGQTAFSHAITRNGIDQDSETRKGIISDLEKGYLTGESGSMAAVGAYAGAISSSVESYEEMQSEKQRLIQDKQKVPEILDESIASVEEDIALAQFYNSFTNGTAESLESYYQSMVSLEKEEAAEMGLEVDARRKDYYKTKANRFISSMKAMEEAYNRNVSSVQYNSWGAFFKYGKSRFLENLANDKSALKTQEESNFNERINKGKSDEKKVVVSFKDIDSNDASMIGQIRKSPEYKSYNRITKRQEDLRSLSKKAYDQYNSIISDSGQRKARKQETEAKKKFDSVSRVNEVFNEALNREKPSEAEINTILDEAKKNPNVNDQLIAEMEAQSIAIVSTAKENNLVDEKSAIESPKVETGAEGKENQDGNPVPDVSIPDQQSAEDLSTLTGEQINTELDQISTLEKEVEVKYQNFIDEGDGESAQFEIQQLTTPLERRKNLLAELKKRNSPVEKKEEGVAEESSVDSTTPDRTEENKAVKNRSINDMEKNLVYNSSVRVAIFTGLDGQSEFIVDEEGLNVPYEFVSGDGSSFNKLYTPVDSQKDPDSPIFYRQSQLGQENARKYYKTKPSIRKKYSVKSLNEVLATDPNTGGILMDSPAIAKGMRLSLVSGANWEFNNFPENNNRFPILIYKEGDLDKDGALINKDTKPLDVMKFNVEGNSFMNDARKRLKEDPSAVINMRIVEKTDGVVNKTNIPNALSEFGHAYTEENGKQAFHSNESFGRKQPLLGIVKIKNSFIFADDAEGDLFSAEEKKIFNQEELSSSQATSLRPYTVDGEEVLPHGTTGVIVQSTNGRIFAQKIKHKIHNDQREERNADGLNRVEYMMNNLEDFLIGYSGSAESKDNNFIRGLSNYVPTKRFPFNKWKKDTLNEFDKDLVKYGVNFTSGYVDGDNNDKRSLMIFVSDRGTEGERLDTGLYYIIDVAKPAKDAASNLNKVLDPDNKFGFTFMKMDQQFNEITNDEGKSYHKGDAALGKELRNELESTLYNTKHNGLFTAEDGQQVMNVNEDYYDPFLDKTFNAADGGYNDYFANHVYDRIDVNPRNPFFAARVFLDTDEATSPEITLPKQDVTNSPSNEGDKKPQKQTLSITQETQEVPETQDYPENIDPSLMGIAEDAAKRQVKGDSKLNYEKVKKEIYDSMVGVDKNLRRSMYVPVKGFHTINQREMNWFLDGLGENKLRLAKNVDYVISKGTRAWGYYTKGMATVAEGAKQGTAYHEGFHMIFDIGMKPREKASILRDARRKYKLKDSVSDLAVEELLAIEFSKYAITAESEPESGLVKRFFDMIIDFINNILPRIGTLNYKFKRIYRGDFNPDITSENNWATDDVKNSSIQEYHRHEVASEHLTSMFSSQMKIMAKNDPYAYMKIISSRTGIGRVVDSMLKHELDENKNPIPGTESGAIIDQIDALLIEATPESYYFASILKDVVNNWFNVKDNLTNIETGYKEQILQTVFDIGFKYKGEKGNPLERNDEVHAEADDSHENMDAIDEQSSENSIQALHDIEGYFKPTKNTISKFLKAWLSFTNLYERNAKGEMVIAKNDVGGDKLINYDEVYDKLREIGTNKKAEKFKEELERIASIDPEIASVLYSLNIIDAKKDIFAIIPSFYSHFNMDHKQMVMASRQGESGNDFKMVISNRRQLKTLLYNQWAAQSELYDKTSENDTIDPSKAKAVTKAYDSMMNEIDLRRKNRSELSNDEYFEYLKDNSVGIFSAIGIGIDNNIFDQIKVNNSDISGAISQAENLIDSAGSKSKSVGLNDIVSSLRGNTPLDPYGYRNNSIYAYAKYLSDHNIGMASAVFYNVANKMVFSINQPNYLSQTVDSLANEDNTDFAEELQQEALHENSIILKGIINRPEFKNNFDKYYLDGIKNKRGFAFGKEYSRSSALDSVNTRLTLFSQNDLFGDYRLINTGTKADKGQSIYIKIRKIDNNKILDALKGYLKNLVDYERQRIRNTIDIKSKGVDYVRENGIDNVVYLDKNDEIQGHGDQFHYIPALNDYLNPDNKEKYKQGIALRYSTGEDLITSKEEQKLATEIIDEAIGNHIASLLLESKKTLDKIGVINLIDVKENLQSSNKPFHGSTTIAVSNNDTHNAFRNNTDQNISSFILNEYLYKLDFNKILMGDMAQYRDVSDYAKRAYHGTTPGVQPASISDSMIPLPKSFKTAIMEDFVIDKNDPLIKANMDNIYNEIMKQHDLSKDPVEKAFFKEKADRFQEKFFEETERTDGFSLIAIDQYRQLEFNAGRWTDLHDEMYERYWSDNASRVKAVLENKLDQRDKELLVEMGDLFNPTLAESLKPFYAGKLADGTTIQIKNSVMPLTKLFAYSFEANQDNNSYRDLYERMKKSKVEYLPFKSSVKIGSRKINKHSDGKELMTFDLPTEYWRMPQSNDTKEDDNQNDGSQRAKLIMDGILNKYTGYMVGGKNLSGENIKKLYNRVQWEKIKRSAKDLSDELHLDEDFYLPEFGTPEYLKSMQIIRDKLRQSNHSRDLTDNFNHNIILNEEKLDFEIPLDFPVLGSKYESILFSLFKNAVMKQKVPGFYLTQIADISGSVENQLKFIDVKDGKIQKAEIAVPAWVAKKMLGLEEGVTLKPGPIPDKYKNHELADSVTYRIPTSGKNLMAPATIARILPDSYGSVIMIPAGMMDQMGSDHDNDKLFVTRRTGNYEKSKVAIDKLLSDESEGLENLSDDSINDLIFNIHESVLTNPIHLAEIVSPLEASDIDSIIDNYKKIPGFSDASDFVDINSLHTDLTYEDLNKFGKQAVGITANATTAKTYLADINANLTVNEASGDYRNAVNISFNGSPGVAYKFDNKYTFDGKLISDVLQSLNSAALDNAKKPKLGFLNINEMNINVVNMLVELGYDLSVATSLVNQPILKKLLPYFNKFSNGFNLTESVKEMINDMPELVSKDYIRKSKDRNEGRIHRNGDKAPFILSLSDLDANLGKKYDANQDDLAFTGFQNQVLIEFSQMFINGRALATLNSMLNPERQAKISSFAQLSVFKNRGYKIENRITFDDFREESENEFAKRTTAYYKYGINNAENFAGQFIRTNTNFYKNFRGITAAFINNEINRPGIVKAMNNSLSFMLSTKDVQLYKFLTAGYDLNDMFFTNNLVNDLMKLKGDPRYNGEPFIKALDAPDKDFRGKQKTLVKSIRLTNLTDSSKAAKNRIVNSWSKLLNSDKVVDGINISDFADKMGVYMMLSSGLESNINSGYEFLDTEFWSTRELVIEEWRKSRGSFNDADQKGTQSDDLQQAAFQYVRSNVYNAPELDLSAVEPVVVGKLQTRVEKSSTNRLSNDLVTPSYYELPMHESIMFKLEVEAGISGTREVKNFLPFLKVESPKIFGNNGYKRPRLLGLVKLNRNDAGKIISAKYEEIQQLGEKNRFYEYTLSKHNEKSIHPANQGVKPIPTEGLAVFSDEAYITDINHYIESIKEKFSYAEGDEQTNPTESSTASSGDEYYSLEGVEVSKEINKKKEESVLKFLDANNISHKAVDNMTERHGDGVLAIADIINMSIEYANDQRGAAQLPEEAAHFYMDAVEHTRLGKRLMERMKNTATYDRVKERYGDLYNNDETKMLKEAAAKEIASYVINGEVQAQNWLRNLIDSIMKYVRSIFKGKDPVQIAASEITEGKKLDFNQVFDSGLYFSVEGAEAEGAEGIKIEDVLDFSKTKEQERLNQFMIKAKRTIDSAIYKMKILNNEESLEKFEQLKSLLDVLKISEFVFNVRSASRFYFNKAGVKFEELSKKNLSEMSVDQIAEDLRSIQITMDSQVGSYSFVEELKDIIVSAKNDSPEGTDLVPLNNTIKTLVEIEKGIDGLRVAANDLRDKRLKALLSSLDPNITEDQASTIIHNVTQDITYFDQHLKYGIKTRDKLIALVMRQLELYTKAADQEIGNLRAKSVIADKEYRDANKGKSEKELFKPFISKDLDKKGYRLFITKDSESWEDLTPSELKYYESVIQPTINLQEELLNKGFRGTIRSRLRVPNVMKDMVESGSIAEGIKIAKDRVDKTLKFEEGQDEDAFIYKTDGYGNPILYVPLRFKILPKSAKENSDLLSDNLSNNIFLSMEDMLIAKEKRRIEPIFTAAEENIYDNEIKDSQGAIVLGKGQSRRFQKIHNLRMMFMYGETSISVKETHGEDAELKRKAIKASEGLRKVTGAVGLGFNLIAMAMSPITMFGMGIAKAAGGSRFNVKTFANAYAWNLRNMHRFLKDSLSTVSTSFETRVLERLNALDDNSRSTYIGKGRGKNLMKNFFQKVIYSGYSMANALGKPALAKATADTIKFEVDGKEISLYEAYDKDHFNSTGDLRYKPEVVKAVGRDILDQAELKVTASLTELSEGNSQYERSPATKHWLGKWFLQHRGFMIPMLSNVWAAYGEHVDLQEKKVGSFRAVYGTVRNMIKDGSVKRGIQAFKLLGKTMENVKEGDLDPIGGGVMNKEKINAYRIAYREALAHTTYSFAVLGGALLVFFGDDDEKLTEREKYAKYILLRMRAEMLSVIAPDDFLRITKSPAAGMRVVDGIFDALVKVGGMKGGWTEEVQSGRLEGYKKAPAAVIKLLPTYNLIKDIDGRISFISN